MIERYNTDKKEVWGTYRQRVNVLFYPDKISSTNVRVIEDKRVQQLCTDVRRCIYYETCATYGLNVDRVFTEG